jgi:hypothetical protein
LLFPSSRTSIDFLPHGAEREAGQSVWANINRAAICKHCFKGTFAIEKVPNLQFKSVMVVRT